MEHKKIIAFVSALTLTLSSAGCGSSGDSSSSSQPETSTAAEASTEAVTTKAAEQAPVTPLSSNSRKVRDTEVPMGDDGTWTVFIYLCGADLESGSAAATKDIIEMAEATENQNVRFVVEVGGAKEWTIESIDANACERYVIEGGDAVKVYEGADVDMGAASSLSDFLKWGIDEYPAAHMGLILWDHGSGSINGVCFDEKHENSSLLLKEIDAALYSVYDDMTDRFEFIGFDACLMGTAETAAVMATHARYMIGSEEIEPGCGWNYTAIGNYLAENPSCGGDELGKVICDSYYEHCKSINQESGVTLSLFDLTKMDDFIAAFDSYSKELYEAAEDTAVFTDFARNINAIENFGGNSRNVGFTNMVDMGGLINAGKDKCPSAEEALSALEETVIYKIKGKDHADASGMSLYYPLRVSGSAELGKFKDVALSSYYLGLVDKVAYGFANNGDISGYDNSKLVESTDISWNPDDYTVTDGTYDFTPDSGNDWSYLENNSSECTFTFDSAPNVDENNSQYSFVLTDESLQKTSYTEAALFLYNEEENEIIQLGLTGEVKSDFETGEFVDGFDGSWFSLPDGQYLPAYLYENYQDGGLYVVPVLLNGERTYLRFIYLIGDEGVNIVLYDYWDGVDENGSVGRSGREIKAGDVIKPIYTANSLEDNSESEFYGSEYTIDENTEIGFGLLEDGIYFYDFIINDIFGNYYEADPIMISVADSRIIYMNPDELE